MGLLTRKMKDTVSLYSVTSDEYGTKTATLSGTVLAMLRLGQSISHATARTEEPTDGILWLDPQNATVKNLAGNVQGMIVRAQKANYLESSNDEHWYEIRSVRVASDLLLGNTTHFIRCTLQKIEPPTLA